MSKIGDWIIEQEQNGDIYYDEWKQRYVENRKRPTAGRLPDELVQMKEEQSFFLPTDDKEHTARKSRALRSRITRLQNEYPEMRFSVRHETKDGQIGVRVFKLGDDDAS